MLVKGQVINSYLVGGQEVRNYLVKGHGIGPIGWRQFIYLKENLVLDPIYTIGLIEGIL